MGSRGVRSHATVLVAMMITLTWSAGVALGLPWSFDEKLHASTPHEGDKFGCAASLSGSTAIVGACYDDDCGTDSGSAWIYELGPTGWTETAKLLASDAHANDQFGVSVCVDGTIAIVGAAFENDWTGAAYVFEKGPSGWTQTTKLTASDPGGDFFGRGVAVSGTTVMVGAYGDDDCGDWSGSVYVFEKESSGWTETGKLIASDASTYGDFGLSVSLNGSMAVIGAEGDDNNTGAAYVFSKGTSGWTEVAKLVASDRAEREYFGRDVAIEGGTAVVGAFQDDDLGSLSGSAYIFEDNGTEWVQVAKLLASDGAEWDSFGESVSLSGDRALIGASGVDRDGSRNFGKVYVFEKTPTGWRQVSGVIALDGDAYDGFGSAVALDGMTALIGAVHDDDYGDYAGSAYVFLRAVDGDANGDGKVDGADLALWQQNYDPVGVTSLLSTGTSVPEPTTCLLLALSLPAIFAARRR